MYKKMKVIKVSKIQIDAFAVGSDFTRVDNTFLYFVYLNTHKGIIKVLVPSFCHKSIIDALERDKEYKIILGVYDSCNEKRYKFIGLA